MHKNGSYFLKFIKINKKKILDFEDSLDVFLLKNNKKNSFKLIDKSSINPVMYRFSNRNSFNANIDNFFNINESFQNYDKISLIKYNDWILKLKYSEMLKLEKRIKKQKDVYRSVTKLFIFFLFIF